jgi:hypothetical protein
MVQGFRPRAPYVLTVTVPDGTSRRVRWTGTRTVMFTVALPKGRGTFILRASGTPPTQISSQDLRVVTVRVSPWMVS